MRTIYLTNLILQIWASMISSITMICLYVGGKSGSPVNPLYLRLLLFNMVVMLADGVALLFRGNMTGLGIFMVRAGNMIAYISNYMLLLTFGYYLIDIMRSRKKVAKGALLFMRIICGGGIIGVVITQFIPLFYYIDSENKYQRGEFFWVSQAIGILCMLIYASMLFRNRKVLERNEKIILGLYIVLPVVALFIQIAVYGLAVLNVANTVSLITVFVTLNAQQGKRLVEQENRHIQDQIAIMMSQIQPHFLYNTLNSIYHLCEQNPSKAQKAIDDFSEYLRENLNALSTTTTIPFENELKHTKVYLELEKMRFGDELNIIYDIQTTAFVLPTLAVQPIVENAVKYGVGKKEGGGTVTIGTKETGNYFEVMIKDDGIGYDINEKKQDGRLHIGIENVSKRIEDMSNGTVVIESEKHVGTTVYIRLPK